MIETEAFSSLILKLSKTKDSGSESSPDKDGEDELESSGTYELNMNGVEVQLDATAVGDADTANLVGNMNMCVTLCKLRTQQ